MLKVILLRHLSMVWISPEISYVNSLENGKLLLRLFVMLKLLMVILLEFSQLLSPRELPRIVRRLLMPKHHKLRLLEKKIIDILSKEVAKCNIN